MIKGPIQQEDITIKISVHSTQEHYIHETNTNRIKGGNRMKCIHFRRLQHTTHYKGQMHQIESK